MASFTVKTARLRDALSPLIQIIPKKTHRDVLKCVRISAKSGDVHSLQLMVTDLDIFAVNVIEDEEDIMVNKEGEFVVPAQTMFDYTKTIDDETITLSYSEEDDLVKIYADSAEFEIGAQELDEYPKFPDLPDDDGWVTLPLEDLGQILSKVLFSVAEQGHPRFGALNAVCIEASEERLSFMSTDQRRASIAHFNIPMGQSKQALVDPKGLAVITKLFDTSPNIYFASDDAVIFSSGSIKLFIRNIHGKYPTLANFIPSREDRPNHLAITPMELLKEVRKAALALDQNKTLKIFLEKNKMCLSTKTRQQRKFAKINMTIPYDGPDTKFSVNCVLLMDLLKAADNEEDIEMFFSRGSESIHFKQNDFDHVLVPLNG